MATILNFSNFTFSAEQIRSVKELLYDEIVKSPELEALHTVYEGIVYDKEIGFVGAGGLVGVANQGCDPTPQAYNIGTRKITWEPKGWEIYIAECFKDIEATAGVYSLKTGIAIEDFSSSDYVNLVLEVLANSVKEFIIRLLWFSDTAATNTIVEELPTAAATEQTTGQAIVGTVYAGVTASTEGAVKCSLANKTIVYLAAAAAEGNAVAETLYYSKDTVNKITIYSGGTITPGVNASYFTILNGFFKQIETQYTANAAQRVTVSENAGVSYSAQALAKTNVQGYLESMVYGADITLRSKADSFILCTQSFYDGYSKSLQGLSLDGLYSNLINGQKTVTFNGIPLIPLPIWDKIILSYYNNGVKLVNPHRAVYTHKDFLAVGLDSIASFSDANVRHDLDSRRVKIELMGKADAKLLNPKMFVVAI